MVVFVDLALPLEFSGLEIETGQHAFSSVGVYAVAVYGGRGSWASVVSVAIYIVGRVGVLPVEGCAVEGVHGFDDFVVADAVEEEEAAL